MNEETDRGSPYTRRDRPATLALSAADVELAARLSMMNSATSQKSSGGRGGSSADIRSSRSSPVRDRACSVPSSPRTARSSAQRRDGGVRAC
jgi:hypothetical protein